MLLGEEYRAARPVLQHVPIDAAAVEQWPRVDLDARIRARGRIGTPGLGRWLDLRARGREGAGERHRSETCNHDKRIYRHGFLAPAARVRLPAGSRIARRRSTAVR